ncbi:hypothetical protein DL771_004207 [Monosporascus sp. 5C6A]|nr:hypothetical protein DL771_004207 [Monosporascus sp. 5C6A]
MPPPKKRDRKKQTRLTFESVVDGAGASSSPAGPPHNYSPVRVRFSDGAASSSSPARSSPSKPAARGRTSKGKSQSRLHGYTGASATSTPRQKLTSASFMPKVHGGRQRATLVDSSDESAAEVDDAGRDDSEDGDLPLLRETASRAAPRFLDADEDVPVPSSIKYPRSSQSVSTRLQKAVIADHEDGDDDDDAPIPPSSALRRRRPAVIELDEEEDDDDDDAPIPPSSALRRRRPAVIELDEDSDSDHAGSPTKKRKMDHPAPSSQKPRRRLESRASPLKPSAHKGHRSAKEKKMELLRRRRAGERIEKLTSSESENGDDRKGIYDTDSEDEFKVLKEFDDDEDEPEVEQEDEAPIPSSRKSKEASRGKAKKREDNGEGNDEDLDDFVVEDDDGPLGAPANLSIPLEFTAAAHKPLKDQFPHVVEWLVHDKINPAFERKDPVYTNAWRKLDDEFRGLANSKFASAAWRTEFYRALKGRPKMEAYEMDAGDADKYDNCTACGRSGHPATFKIVFQGSPYYKDTLQEVESSDDEDSDEASDDDDKASVDTQGMPLPPQSREWHVGAVCCANAETAHGLIHWKHALKEWVEGRLEDEGWTSARRVQERERMKPKKRRALANSIVDGWVERGVVRALYGDFKLTLENARNKATTGRGRMR